MNGDLVIIPGGMTSQLQVLDVVVNKPFKDNLRKKYTEWLLSGNHALTPTGKIQKPCCDRTLQRGILGVFFILSFLEDEAAQWNPALKLLLFF
ncbi:hypothetical protein J4Q44_G00038310 [Coregonus suidteri]|uniref:DDE-1 domain-containing protein n=1 Tax=Coregonus suidteri TaxID=861788 RepID=A0AAN8M878_9TELE